jgi:hypothetical protein
VVSSDKSHIVKTSRRQELSDQMFEDKRRNFVEVFGVAFEVSD